MPTPQQLWSQFLDLSPVAISPDVEYTTWHFCDTKDCANELLRLVIRGMKTATASAIWTFELSEELIPSIGDISIITDWDGNAGCIIRTSEIDITPFDDVDSEFAALEGEGDRSLAFWRQVHWEYFTRELAKYNRKPDPKMPILCERFEVLFSISS